MTPQSKAIQDANTLMALCSQGISLYYEILALQASWATDGAGTMLAAMNTMTQNADGSLGPEDTVPNPAHPLNVNMYTGLSKAVSANQLTAAMAVLTLYVNTMNGQAIPATPNIPATLLQVSFP